MKTSLVCFVASLIALTASSQPTWQANKQLSVGSFVACTVADGYGQHVLVPRDTHFVHYLIGNGGAVISSHSGNVSIPRVTVDNTVAITEKNGVVSVVADSMNHIIVFRTSDGGKSWSRTAPHNTGDGTYQIDAYDDGTLIHIVWANQTSSPDKVYYLAYRILQEDFANQQDITADIDGGGGTVFAPKVVSNSEKVVVSFVRTDTSPDLSATRTYDISSEEWESTYNTVTYSSSPSSNAKNQDIALRGDSVHIAMRLGFGLETRYLYTATRSIDGNWVDVVQQAQGGDESDFRKFLIAVDDTCFSAYGVPGSPNLIRFHQYTSGNGWQTYVLNSSSSTAWVRENLTSSRTGVYVFYTSTESPPTQYMRRRVYTLSGNISTNMFWTDSNWVSDDIHIQTGATVTIKENSATFLAANKSIYVEPGGAIVFENNTNLAMGGGTKILVKSPSGLNPGGILRLANNKVLTISSGDSLVAEAGSQFEFGTNARIDIDGQITVSGSSGSHVTFALAGGASGTWAGIKVQGYPYSTIAYADFSDVSTGVQLLDADSPNSRSVTYCTFTDVTATGILLNSISNVTITDNTLTASGSDAVGISCITASPSGVLRNRLDGFKFGLYCTDGSSPVLENGVSGGYNVIRNGETGVACDGGSDAVLGYISGALGDEGGQNSIYNNSSYDVLLESSEVSAENIWWGSKEDPPGVFSVDGESSLDYDPWLESDPNPWTSLIAGGGKMTPEKKTGKKIVGNLGPGASLESELMSQALDQRTNGEYEDAASTLKSIISSETETSAAKGWAIRQLLAVSQCMEEPALVAYLGNLGQTNRALTRDIDGVLPAAKLYEGSRSNAMAAYSDNAENYPETWLERAAVYQLFLQALYREKDAGTASSLCSRLSTSYSGSIEAFLAATQLSDASGATSPGATVAGARKKSGQSGSATAAGNGPTAFALAQNYPNPFNPATTIRFDIPFESHVTLKVFDVLGKEAFTLVDEQMPAGFHRVNFDARGLPSGMYFYRLTAGSFSDVRKLVLVK